MCHALFILFYLFIYFFKTNALFLEKQQKWFEKEREMDSGTDRLEQRMTEMSENTPEDKKCCFPGLFKYFGYE